VWQRILQVRTLVLAPDDDPVMWIKFANLCRKSDHMLLAEKTINSLLSPGKQAGVSALIAIISLLYTKSEQLSHLQDRDRVKAPPDVVYAQLKYMWANGNQQECLHFLGTFTDQLTKDLGVESEAIQKPGGSKTRRDELLKLLSRCYFKQAQWQSELLENWGAVSFSFSSLSSIPSY
jgi:serine/threonine-protein kinase mTOR